MAVPNPTGREIVGLGVNARYTGDRAQAPRTNSALQLAESLQDLNPQLQTFLGRYGEQLVERAKQSARRDVLLSSGTRFADAVRNGQIEPTQNPFYIQAYNQEVGQVQGRASLAELQEQATTWEERNDPRAFQERWNLHVGALAEQFKDSDELAGFRAEEAQFTQQTVAANTAQNVERIERERVSLLAAIVSNAVSQANLANGGAASPEQITEAVEAARLQVMDTGGTEDQWADILTAGITSSAYAQGDPDLLDYLRVPGFNAVAPYSRPGVAEQVESDRYRIEQAAGASARARAAEIQAQIAVEGEEGVTQLFTEFGPAINAGNLDPDRMTTFLRNAGVSERAISYALNSVQRTIADSQSLSNAYFARDPRVTSLLVRARAGTLTPEQIASEVVAGTITNSDASALLATASSQAGAGGGEVVANATQLRQALENLNSLVASQLSQAGRTVSAQQRQRHQLAIIDAARAHLATNPGDFQGAHQAARNAAASQVTTYLQRRAAQGSVSRSTPDTPNTPAQPEQEGANPRR